MNDKKIIEYLMSPDRIVFTKDAKGGFHFATEWLPVRTIFCPEMIEMIIAETEPFIMMNQNKRTVTIILDGETLIYDRTGYDHYGNWLCDLRIDDEPPR